MLNEIFNEYIQDPNFNDSDRVKEIRAAINKFTDQHLDKVKATDLSDLITVACAEHEEQGFINGFKYATAIWKEC